jgi:hypothetical protein
MRPILLALALAAITLPCAAGEPSQWLDSSVVTFPEKVDKYTLNGTLYDPQQFVYGVASNWTVEGAPKDLKLDVYVYPLGRNDEGEVVSEQIADVENGVKEAARQGLYTNPVVGARSPFVVVRPAPENKDKKPPPFDPTPQDEFELKPTKGKDADPIVTAVADSWHSSNSHGIRQSFEFEREGAKYRSLAYVFYRSLFGFKLRISVPEDEMGQADFEAAADRAARWLVPQILVQSFGTCGSITIPSGKGSKPEDSGAIMVREISRVMWESCAAEKGKTAPKGKSVEIVYPAGTWQSD